MKKEVRTIVYDEQLRIEAYLLEGIVQPFPNHFHDHYVIGFMEGGERYLSCKNREYNLRKGDIVIFNPGDNHGCAQIGEEAICYLRPLHEMVMNGIHDFGKEENLLFLISTLIQNYGQPFENGIPECREEIEKACAFIKQHLTERISLDEICECAGLSKSTLLRAFTKSKGITPYRYLETIRINRAKKLLAEGVSPIETAMETGFSDQSHFTNYFSSFIGLAPGVYRDIFFEKRTDGEE